MQPVSYASGLYENYSQSTTFKEPVGELIKFSSKLMRSSTTFSSVMSMFVQVDTESKQIERMEREFEKLVENDNENFIEQNWDYRVIKDLFHNTRRLMLLKDYRANMPPAFMITVTKVLICTGLFFSVTGAAPLLGGVLIKSGIKAAVITALYAATLSLLRWAFKSNDSEKENATQRDGLKQKIVNNIRYLQAQRAPLQLQWINYRAPNSEQIFERWEWVRILPLPSAPPAHSVLTG